MLITIDGHHYEAPPCLPKHTTAVSHRAILAVRVFVRGERYAVKWRERPNVPPGRVLLVLEHGEVVALGDWSPDEPTILFAPEPADLLAAAVVLPPLPLDHPPLLHEQRAGGTSVSIYLRYCLTNPGHFGKIQHETLNEILHMQDTMYGQHALFFYEQVLNNLSDAEIDQMSLHLQRQRKAPPSPEVREQLYQAISRRV